jgi:hypothetical protein
MKIFAMTMTYNRTFLISQSLEFFKETVTGNIEAHYLLDQHYPLHHSSPIFTAQYNSQWLRDVAHRYGFVYRDVGKNLGYHFGINEIAMNIPEISDEDILINYDPDSMPLTYGWDEAIRKAFEHNPHLVTVGLVNQVIEAELQERGYNEHVYDGLRVRYPHRAGVMSIIAWKAGFIRKVGGLKEPCALYGGIEGEMWPVIQAHGGRWGYLPDYHESPDLGRYADPEYTEWKRLHGHTREFPGDFDSYLRHIGRIE